jgi:hypothetical protein
MKKPTETNYYKNVIDSHLKIEKIRNSWKVEKKYKKVDTGKNLVAVG